MIELSLRKNLNPTLQLPSEKEEVDCTELAYFTVNQIEKCLL